MKRLLLLGGIGEALALARRLGPAHLYSLAGLGKVPGDLACQVRVGGYGGAEGLAAFIDEQGFDLLVDATHPYAARISRNAVRAARLAGVPCWALRRARGAGRAPARGGGGAAGGGGGGAPRPPPPA
ncbi:precorrin-6A/cobalt-precorrin-6A reductase, partial [Pseudomonas aeruginosa]|uniref:precorrin-6A/cobalt-precorrin-6A reductase n=1 Tax=Pseudomonas aeruginosa TaxID=287 RepID=UPI0021F0BBF0